MLPREREYYLQRILAGGPCFRLYLLGEPPLRFRSLVGEIGEKIFSRAVRRGTPTQAQTEQLLRGRGLWTAEDEKNLHQLEREIDDYKVSFFEKFHQERSREIVRKMLEETRQAIESLTSRRSQLYLYTAEAMAELARKRAETAWGARKHGKYVWRDLAWMEDRSGWVDRMAAYKAKKTISEVILRELARTEPFLSLYSPGKTSKGIFGVPSARLSPEQRGLMAWAGLYENVRGHPDCPQDDVIACDDAMDGWLISQRRKRESQQLGSEADRRAGSNKDKQEIYLPAETLAEKLRIDAMNSQEGRKKVEARLRAIQEKGYVREDELPDRAQEIRMQMAKLGSK